MKNKDLSLSISLPTKDTQKIKHFFERSIFYLTIILLTTVSVFCFMYYLENGLGLAYNDARSHLDIGRRVVEGLKPGLAQLGSVWLPLPHLLMVPTIWNDVMWHTGLSGALQSMISFIATGVLIYLFLSKIGVGILGRVFGVLTFVLNVNILYLQSTPMTELLLLVTLLAGSYELMLWFKEDKILNLIKSSFWIMLATLIRYEGWFLLVVAAFLIFVKTFKEKGYKASEGLVFFFVTLGGFGVFLWFLWNQLIFKDALYFIFGPFSAHAQQQQLETAGVLATKGDLLFSIKIYISALIYNSYAYNVVFALLGVIIFWFDGKISARIKIASLALFAPLVFNILALYLGHSVLFIQGLSGNTWFNVRYGIMMIPAIAIFIGYLIHRARNFKYLIIGVFLFGSVFAFLNYDAVTIDDARVGSSQKNVSEVSGWLKEHAKDKEGFVLISAASHDAIIFSSGLPMKKFIHEGTGKYWESATTTPDRWARWIIMRTNDNNDLTFKSVSKAPGYKRYKLVESFPFADIYEIEDEYVKDLHTQPVLGRQR